MGMWDIIVEKRIQAAMNEGAFDHLRGMGEPFRWPEEDECLDPEWRLAVHLLRSNGFAPEWIEDKKAIEADLAGARARLARAWGWRGRLQGDGAEAAWQAEIALFRKRVREINKAIEVYNLRVPSLQVQRLFVEVDAEIRRVTGQA